MRGLLSCWSGLSLGVLVAGACWVLGRRAELAFAAHRVQWAQDLAFFHQIFHAAAEGRPWTSSLLLEPTGFLQMVHFHPVFALLLPLYRLRPEATTLLWFNVAAVVLAAVPVHWLARDAARQGGRGPHGARAFGLAAALAFLVWLPAQMAALADFRPMVFFIPGFLLALAGVMGRSGLKAALGVLICFAAREESAYLVGAVGVCLLLFSFGGRRRWWGLGFLLGAGAYFLFLLKFKGNFFFHFNPVALLQGAGGSAGGDPLLTRQRLLHVGLLLLGGYAPLLVSPAALSMSCAPLVYLFSTPAKEWHAFTGTYPYYRDALLPFMVAGGVLGWTWLVARLRPGRRPLGMALAAVLMVLGNGLAFRGERQRLAEGLWVAHEEEARSLEVAEIDGLLARVGPAARVATDYRLIAALSGRRVLWNIAHLYMDGGEPPFWEVEWPLTLDRVDTVVVPLDDPFVARMDDAWRLTGSGGGYGLWRRVRPPAGGLPEPLP